ncbi:MAG TPA: PEP/pyruvate-binding domain-containing protein [Spirochaetota bacterium]|nr:PEP/pyruvate-binding domain-containing protein [Spirochaetota bacterium]
MKTLSKISTGLASLDKVCNGLRLGDNVVWQVDEIDDYRSFAVLYAEKALKDNRRLIYIRFALHDPILRDNQCSEMYYLDAFSGFESFSTEVHTIIKREGKEVYYVFDCLSDLQSAWANDLMIGNFFMITCPYLFELDTVAYFSLLHNSISFRTIASIRETTQLLLDLYNSDGSLYVHPLKVWNRYSPTMFFPHLLKGTELNPITNSLDAARLITHIQKKGYESTIRNLDYWDRIFLKAADLIQTPEEIDDIELIHTQLCKSLITRDDRILVMVRKFFKLDDFLFIKDRLIGSGFIGGKTVGMMLARKILENDSNNEVNSRMEPHDSFFIGSDVYYTYIVQNGWWRLFIEHKTDEKYFSSAEELYEKMLHGTFPDTIKEKFQQIIEYYGQSPIIVRSSSLLEDGFGNAFAGKYESYFLVNQGAPEERFEQFLNAVQKIYASTMDVDAISYRHQRGLHKLDEQMALLVQRVSGSYNGNYFFPDMAGVGFSYNTFVWKKTMDPRAGMLRIVLGLGTRAVNRTDGDYPRIVALDDPLVKPYGGINDARNFSQHKIDLLNIKDNTIETQYISDLTDHITLNNIELMAERDSEAESQMHDHGMRNKQSWIINFDNLLAQTNFSENMKHILSTLESAYDYPVDIEFTINFGSDGNYRINLLQCRPQQTKMQGKPVSIPKNIPGNRILFSSEGNFLGGNISQPVSRIIYVDPYGYSALSQTQKYDIARLIGKLNRQCSDRESNPTMLMGPGRWGTTTPSLGVPVRFSEINNISVLVEIALMRDDFIPELSFGTHFFQDLVETDIFYVALFPEIENVIYNTDWFKSRENGLAAMTEDGNKYQDVVKVYDAIDSLFLMSDILSQKLFCFISDHKKS